MYNQPCETACCVRIYADEAYVQSRSAFWIVAIRSRKAIRHDYVCA